MVMVEELTAQPTRMWEQGRERRRDEGGQSAAMTLRRPFEETTSAQDGYSPRLLRLSPLLSALSAPPGRFSLTQADSGRSRTVQMCLPCTVGGADASLVHARRAGTGPGAVSRERAALGAPLRSSCRGAATSRAGPGEQS